MLFPLVLRSLRHQEKQRFGTRFLEALPFRRAKNEARWQSRYDTHEDDSGYRLCDFVDAFLFEMIPSVEVDLLHLWSVYCGLCSVEYGS